MHNTLHTPVKTRKPFVQCQRENPWTKTSVKVKRIRLQRLGRFHISRPFQTNKESDAIPLLVFVLSICKLRENLFDCNSNLECSIQLKIDCSECWVNLSICSSKACIIDFNALVKMPLISGCNHCRMWFRKLAYFRRVSFCINFHDFLISCERNSFIYIFVEK